MVAIWRSQWNSGFSRKVINRQLKNVGPTVSSHLKMWQFPASFFFIFVFSILLIVNKWIKFCQWLDSNRSLWCRKRLSTIVTIKKSPNVYESCQKIKDFSILQKLSKNVGDLWKLIVASRLWKVPQSPINRQSSHTALYQLSHNYCPVSSYLRCKIKFVRSVANLINILWS